MASDTVIQAVTYVVNALLRHRQASDVRPNYILGQVTYFDRNGKFHGFTVQSVDGYKNIELSTMRLYGKHGTVVLPDEEQVSNSRRSDTVFTVNEVANSLILEAYLAALSTYNRVKSRYISGVVFTSDLSFGISSYTSDALKNRISLRKAA